MTGRSSEPAATPEVSVVIPVHDAGRWIGAQLDALAAQEDAPSFEVLVCDNNSRDDSADRARAHPAGLAVRVVDASGPASASFARNRGATEAHGPVLAFCDADDLVDPGWLRELLAVHRAAPRALVAGDLRHAAVNPSEVLAAYELPLVDEAPTAALRKEPVPGPPFAGYLATVAGGNLAVARSVYLSLGGMDPSYPGGAEETDFAWRAQEAGHSVVTAPGALVHYRLRHDARGVFRQQRIQQRARVLLWCRYRDRGMSGPSALYSVRTALREAPGLLSRDRSRRLAAARQVGGNLGALQGIVVHRLLGRRPAPAVGDGIRP